MIRHCDQIQYKSSKNKGMITGKRYLQSKLLRRSFCDATEENRVDLVLSLVDTYQDCRFEFRPSLAPNSAPWRGRARCRLLMATARDWLPLQLAVLSSSEACWDSLWPVSATATLLLSLFGQPSVLQICNQKEQNSKQVSKIYTLNILG